MVRGHLEVEQTKLDIVFPTLVVGSLYSEGRSAFLIKRLISIVKAGKRLEIL